jgi:hypothetical protein
MVNETPAGLLTVRELRRALDDAHPDQVVIVALAGQELSELEAAVSNGLEMVFPLKVDRATIQGPVFRLAAAIPQTPEA